MTKEEKMEILDKDIELLSLMREACIRIRHGESEPKVLSELNIPPKALTVLRSKALQSVPDFPVRQVDDGKPWHVPTLNGADRLFTAVVQIGSSKVKLSEIPSDVEKTMECVLKTLSNRERAVLRMRYWECLTLEECANALGVTRERIRQVEAKALRKLRQPSRFKYIRMGEGYYRKERDRHIAAEIEVEKERSERLKEQLSELNRIKQENKKTEDKIRELGGMTPDKNAVNSWNIPIADMELSTRSYNCLKRAGIDTVGDIALLSYEELLKVRNLGKKSFDEIADKVNKLIGIDIQR